LTIKEDNLDFEIAFERLMNYASTPVGGIRDKQGQGAQNGQILVVHHERVIADSGDDGELHPHTQQSCSCVR
jgi:hypothetical protein